MRIFIVGICGTFMAGIAMLAKQQGHDVLGCDEQVYPPMSTQLHGQGIEIFTGYDPTYIDVKPDLFIIGNVVRRGNGLMEAILNARLPYTSGPAWLATHILAHKRVLAIAGTHGKTTTSALLAFLLQKTGHCPGFLIGGLASDLGTSAALGQSDWFVIEADEYDTAFFDKRSKFIHYRPDVLALNNLEFDHADIFEDLAAIKNQFHYLIRTIAGNALIIGNRDDPNINDVLQQGCWTPQHDFSVQNTTATWFAKMRQQDGRIFEVYYQGQCAATVQWSLLGQHNMANALVAIAAAHRAGVPIKAAAKALTDFKGVKRRLELKGVVCGVSVYDDFAHHPTAIASTLAGLRASVGDARVIVVLELGSYTMREGKHGLAFINALNEADHSILLQHTKASRALDASTFASHPCISLAACAQAAIEQISQMAKAGDHIVVMSNTGFAKHIDALLKGLAHHKNA